MYAKALFNKYYSPKKESKNEMSQKHRSKRIIVPMQVYIHFNYTPELTFCVNTCIFSYQIISAGKCSCDNAIGWIEIQILASHPTPFRLAWIFTSLWSEEKEYLAMD